MILATLSLLPAFAAGPESPGFRRFALIVGANVGGRERVTLRYAVDDARSVSTVLQQLGGVSPTDEVLLANPTRGALISALGDVRARVATAEAAGARTELVLYYSGHSDDEALMLGEDRLRYDELRSALALVNADVRVVILDSCSSGALVREKGGVKRPAFLADASMDVSGSAYLTSSSADEAAQESDKLGGSFFTHFLVSGLRGAADQSGDGRVTLTEAYQFAYDETLQRTERTQAGAQHPEWGMHLAGTGDLVITDLRNTTAGLVVDESIQGRINVRDAEQRLVAELYKPLGKRVELGLVPGRYAVLVDDAGRLREATFTVAEAGMVRLSSLTFTTVHGEVARVRGTTDYHDEIVSFGIIPPIGFGAANIRQHAALSLGVNGAARLDGAQIAVVGNQARDGVGGLQLSSVFNTTGGAVGGMQVSAGLNYAREGVTGVQTAPITNWAGGDLRGVQGTALINYVGGVARGGQVAGSVNVAHGALAGVQAAGGANLADGGTGGQLAGGVNVASGPLTGVQVAGGINVAEAVHGAQLAPVNAAGEVEGLQVGTVNAAKTVKGVQLSVVNVAKDVDGVQVGVINLADDVDGVSVGVLSFSRTGYNHASAWVDASGMANAGFTFGGKQLYTIATIGTHVDAPSTLWTAQLGLGGHVPVGAFYVDFDGTAGNLGPFTERAGGLLTRAKVVVGHEFVEHLALFVGPTFDLQVTRGGAALPERVWLPGGEIPAGDREMPWRLGLAVGLRI